jgi:hypothetical protein
MRDGGKSLAACVFLSGDALNGLFGTWPCKRNATMMRMAASECGMQRTWRRYKFGAGIQRDTKHMSGKVAPLAQAGFLPMAV